MTRLADPLSVAGIAQCRALGFIPRLLTKFEFVTQLVMILAAALKAPLQGQSWHLLILVQAL